MTCLAVGQVGGPKEWEYGSYRMQKRTTKKWREDWLGEITKTREVDRDFDQTQLDSASESEKKIANRN